MSHGIKHYPGKSRSNAHFPHIDPRSFSQGLSREGWGALEPSTWQGRTLFSTLAMQVLSSVPSMCLKSQIVDLKAEGYWEELMDTFRPDIVVKDW